MYLKRIEIHGFKSFANKIILDFHDGITGIVGPNGSGKSNVADAVRWVLGEQSARQLRGSKMEDVIFAGTQARKPLGYAYVALTMDNSDHKLPIDFDEVTIARRVYRSGESEYLINNAPCRLKDVQELFMDTGIGKEGYSIIGQGQIDRILSGKPEDRRELFDEAAGIVKFKRRKMAAEKNLEEERLNLSRVTDIMKEIESRLGPLKEQSEVAKQYLKLKEELKNLEVAQFLKEYDKIKVSKQQLEDKLNIAASDFERVKAEYENTREEYLDLERQLEKCDEEIEAERNAHNGLLLSKEKAEGEIKVLNEQIASLMHSGEYYQGRIASSLKDIEAKKAEELGYISEKKSIDDKISDLDDKLSIALVELERIKDNISRYTKEIEECNNSIYECLNENSGIKSNMQRYETMLEQNAIRKAELNQRILKNKSEEIGLDSEIEKYKAELDIVSEEIKSLSGESASTEQAIIDTQAEIDRVTLLYNEAQNHYLREKSRYESLVNLTERYEGYGNSIKKVMEQKSRLKGIIGVVADIIRTDKKYETAIETALGSSIQNIVTEDEETAKELIAYLKQNKYGRATFLPLTNITSSDRMPDARALKENGVIGIAADLTEYDKKFAHLAGYLLGRIIVADNIDNAARLARKYNYTLRIVTLEGELLTPGGSISGGAYRNASNLLGRRRELEELEELINSLENNTKDLGKRREAARDYRGFLRNRLEEIKNKLQEKAIIQNTSRMNLEREMSRKEQAQNACREYERELAEIDMQARELDENLNKLKEALNDNIVKNKSREAEIERLTKLLEQERELERIANEKASSLKMELSSLEQSNQFLMENVRRVKKDIERLYEEEEALNFDIKKASEAARVKKQNVSNLEELISSYDNSLKELDIKIKELVKEREKITANHKSFFAKRDELSVLMNNLDKECLRLSTQREKLIEQMDMLMNYMWEEYELSYTTAQALNVDASVSLTQAKKSIQEIKAQIKELGDVNVNAIEEYKSHSERYAFLQNQSEDLIRAEEALLQIINELDDEMRKQFEKEFNAINKQFDIVFKELFGGGMAGLELTDSEDILEAGIRINAQPPGKKLQNIMQLSGGEKALTAICLLFAILNLKPSPFCLLDEIEAALDDPNVKRFAKYLNKLKKETQFIIITHRRGTMATADVLYGITMQEKGVSAMVSVSLIEDELDK